jgi:hypothetical protein
MVGQRLVVYLGSCAQDYANPSTDGLYAGDYWNALPWNGTWTPPAPFPWRLPTGMPCCAGLARRKPDSSTVSATTAGGTDMRPVVPFATDRRKEATVETEFKNDWPEARERLTRWWADQPTDRVAAAVVAPRRGMPPPSFCDKSPEKYTDAPTVLRNVEAGLRATFCGGEAFPTHWVNLGPVPLSGYMGCGMHLEPNTIWHSPRFQSWGEAECLAFDRSNRWYRLLQDLTRASLQQACGRYLVSGQAFGCSSDVIADLWGLEPTLEAMLERPAAVAAAARTLTAISKTLYDEMDALCAPHQQGTIDWLCLWCPGRIWTLQSDLCCMISPEHFRDFVLEELRAEAEHVDHSFYHLDGPGAIRHLDALLSIQALDGIQWVPGAGSPEDPIEWIDLFRRVQAAGKKLLIYCPPERVTPLLEKIAKQGVFLWVWASSQDQAECVLSELDRIGM